MEKLQSFGQISYVHASNYMYVKQSLLIDRQKGFGEP